VHVTNVTENFAAFNLAGPRSREVLTKVANGDVSNAAFPYMHVRQTQVAGVMCNIFRIGFTGELSYEIHVPAGYGLHVWEALMEAGAEFDILPFGLEAQRVLRLEKGHIIVGQDTDALTDPISADLAGLVKHDKTNFLGNRPLARIAKDGPKQKLVGFKMVTAGVVPEEGLQIVKRIENRRSMIEYQNLEIIGWVTSCRYSPTLNEVIGLCWLPSQVAEQEGASFTIRREGKLVEARVHHGAFYDVEGMRLRS
jgi:sarcosine oxidase subunit alpha